MQFECDQIVATMFNHSDMNCNGIIELFEVYKTCKNLNLKMLMDELEDLFWEANQNKYVAIDRFELWC
jgi:Ca2+-binding EF-hand superfamily protein